jgi:glucokinase
MMKRRIAAAVDIGGTNIRCAVAGVEEPTRLLARRTVRTPADAGPRALIELVYGQVCLCLDKAGLGLGMLVSVGCTAPGVTDAVSGIVVAAANLPGWNNLPLAQMLEDRFGLAVAVENDVRAAAQGESRYGSGKGCRSLIYMTISTGVSAGIIVDGHCLRGHHNFAGEIAYMLLEPAHIGQDWGVNGCLELTAGGVGIAREWAARHQVETEDYSAVEVFAAARAGNVEAKSIIARVTAYLSQAAVALCAVIDPEVLVIGGGIAENEPQLIDRIGEVVRATLLLPPRVVQAGLGRDSPLIGALALAVEKAEESAGL